MAMSMSTAAGVGGGTEAQAGGPTSSIRLYLRASNLPKSISQRQPDTLAQVSWLSPQNGVDDDSLSPFAPLRSSGGSDHAALSEFGNLPSTSSQGKASDETEVVYRSSNPRWTSSFPAQYELGSQLLFFVDVFSVRSTNIAGSGDFRAKLGNMINKSGTKHLGRAVFDVQDVLGNANKIKARRLRKGGIVYAHVEQKSSQNESPTRSSDEFSSPASASRLLSLRLRADSLVHTQSIRARVVPDIMAKPDTYFEVSRQSAGAQWVVVYRSPPVKESVSPMWDEATIDLGSFRPVSSRRLSLSTASSSSIPGDLSSLPIMITVYKVKKNKVKQIGSFETSVESLMDACRTMAKVTGFECGHSACKDEAGEDHKIFQLRPNPTGRSDVSERVTGNISVVKASIENSHEVWNRSQKLFSGDDDINGEKSFCEMHDGEPSANINPVLPTQSRKTFSDYVRSGMVDIDMCVAIDFTSSNGDPTIPGTLHYSRGGMMNDYMEAVVAIGSTIEKYSASKEYPVWGFGAKYDGNVCNVFQCGDSQTARGTDGVLDAYRQIFETGFTMSGPTVLSSILKAAAARSKRIYRDSSESKMGYCVLLILTDGIVTDLQATQDLVRSYRNIQLPLSVVVVGIGRADFVDFHRWNNSPPEVRGRFTFVEFREYQFDPDSLSRKALLNVPHEVVEYISARHSPPH